MENEGQALPVRKDFRLTKFDLYGSTKAASTVCKPTLSNCYNPSNLLELRPKRPEPNTNYLLLTLNGRWALTKSQKPAARPTNSSKSHTHGKMDKAPESSKKASSKIWEDFI
jgi:hypothetical protein